MAPARMKENVHKLGRQSTRAIAEIAAPRLLSLKSEFLELGDGSSE
jgi:hypothetical protein